MFCIYCLIHVLELYCHILRLYCYVTKCAPREIGKGTVQTFNSCTRRSDVCQCLVVQTPTDNIICQENMPSTSMAHEACESKVCPVVRSGTCSRIHDQKAWWQPGVRQGLSRNASSVSFGHAEHCFLTVWTPKSLCQNLLKMTFLRR